MSFKYFKLEEFACKHTGKNNIDHRLVRMLDEAREYYGSPIKINSGFRDKTHPESVKNPSSSHIKGLAADISCTDSTTRAKLLEALVHANFKRYGLHKSFIHVDIDDEDKPSPVIFLY